MKSTPLLKMVRYLPVIFIVSAFATIASVAQASMTCARFDEFSAVSDPSIREQLETHVRALPGLKNYKIRSLDGRFFIVTSEGRFCKDIPRCEHRLLDLRNGVVTLERAARDYAKASAIDRFALENESSEALATRVDAMRADALAKDPHAAEFFGFELPKAKADKSDPDKASSERAARELPEKGSDHTVEGLDPEIEKALQHPQVAQAIEQRIGEAEKTRQSYLNGLAAATQIAQVSFLSQFPELAGVAMENMPAALQQMSQQDPQKFARVQMLIANAEQMFAQQQQESRRQAETARQNFMRFAKSEDARLETMLKGESKATQHAVTSEIFASAKASGVEPAELFRLFNSEPLMRNAVFQRMMYDAGKYRLMMKAKDAATAKPIPPVQRPGMARTPAERDHADVRTLSAKLSSSGDIRDAVALYNARRASKR